MKKHQIELSGEAASSMNHKMVLSDESGWLFIETRKESEDGTE